MDDLLNEFLTETGESIDVVDVEIVKLEQDPSNKPVIDNIFRLVHTIKGTCGFLGLPRLESVAHSAENVLSKFRDGELEVTQDSVTIILESLDCIKEILAAIEATEEEPEGDDSDLIGRLDAIAAGETSGASAPPEPSEPDTVEGEIVDVDSGRSLKPGEVSLEELEAAFASAPGPEESEVAETPAASDEATSGSLYDRIGGEDTLAVVAHIISNKLINHSTLSAFFGGQDAEALKSMFMGLLAALYQDQADVAESVGGHLTNDASFGDMQFDALTAVVSEAMKECQVAADFCDEATMAMELVRDVATSAAQAEVAKKAKAEKSKASAPAAGGDGRKITQSIRVSVDLLEDLMNMVSELVLTRNQLMQICRNQEDNELLVPLQRLSQCTTELQEGVMKTRMQPIGNAWAKLPRIVRDLTVELDKKIDLQMLGADTELDRQVLELIKDPLTHMVRNSADHGIEMPNERLALGKKETGTIRLNAYHEGGHIIIEITDDGRGLSASKLIPKILEKGLATQAELDEMSEAQIQRFIFHAGFSMAAKVTSVSGRGVGMDVVRSNIEKIGGTIDMSSTEGKGTTFLIKIPLTLAIVSALIVQAQGNRFAIPQISVLELVRAAEGSEYEIENINDAPVVRLRNRLLPLVYLNDVLGLKRDDQSADSEEDKKDDGTTDEDFIVVAQVGSYIFGIVVDQVFDTEEIVVKPVAPILKDLPIYSGNTILGDGSVIMIIDTNGVAYASNAGATEQESEDQQEDDVTEKAMDDTDSLLLFRAGNGNPKAVMLSLVARLEDFPVEDFEDSNGRYVVQYRGSLMPIVMADPSMTLTDKTRQPVLVFSDGEYTMGLAVEKILDIVEAELNLNLGSATPGIVGSAIIEDKATEVIDVTYFLSQAFANWLEKRDAIDESSTIQKPRILLIDDSDFFRNMLKPLLSVAGYQVSAVSSAQAALDMREAGVMFDMIVSDIEMPEISGFDFAKSVKSDPRWSSVPLVALSALTSERDLERGRAVGFDDYVAKFDKETLLQALSMQLKIQGDAA